MNVIELNDYKLYASKSILVEILIEHRVYVWDGDRTEEFPT